MLIKDGVKEKEERWQVVTHTRNFISYSLPMSYKEALDFSEAEKAFREVHGKFCSVIAVVPYTGKQGTEYHRRSR